MFDKIPTDISVRAFRDFALKQKGKYNYTNQSDCAFAQFLRSLDYSCFVSYEYFRAYRNGTEGIWSSYKLSDIHPKLAEIYHNEGEKHTFKDLADRLDNLL